MAYGITGIPLAATVHCQPSTYIRDPHHQPHRRLQLRLRFQALRRRPNALGRWALRVRQLALIAGTARAAIIGLTASNAVIAIMEGRHDALQMHRSCAPIKGVLAVF